MMDTNATTQLTVLQRAAVALGASEREKQLVGLATKHTGITAITNEAGRDDCHSAYMELKAERVDLEKRGKEAREDAQAFAKAVITEEKRLVGIIGTEEDRLKKLRDDWDAEVERKRVAEAEAELHRVQGLQARIADIRAIPAASVAKSSADLEQIIETTRGRAIGPDFAEFRVEAEDALRSTLAQLCVMVSGRKAEEEKAEKAAKDLAELERLRRERDERVAKEEAERQAKVRAEEEERRARIEKEETERRAAQAEADRKQREVLAEQRAQQEKELAAAKAKQEAELAAQRVEQERVAAEARARQEAEEQRLADERAEVERKRVELEEQEARINASAPIFYKALRKLEPIVTPGSTADGIIQQAFRAAGLQ